MEDQKQNFVSYNFNWLYVVDNNSVATSYLDSSFFHPDVVSSSLRSLKSFLLSIDAPMLLSAPGKFIPLRDYILSGFDNQLQAATNEQIQDLASSEHSLESCFRTCTIVYDEPAFEYLDLVTPSKFTQEMRVVSNTEFYVFPIKMTLLEQDAEKAILHIGSLLNDEATIRQTISHFEQTQLMTAAILKANRIALTPLLADNKLRSVVADIKKITGKMKNGTGF